MTVVVHYRQFFCIVTGQDKRDLGLGDPRLTGDLFDDVVCQTMNNPPHILGATAVRSREDRGFDDQDIRCAGPGRVASRTGSCLAFGLSDHLALDHRRFITCQAHGSLLDEFRLG